MKTKNSSLQGKHVLYNKVYNLLCRLQPPSVVDYKTTKTQIAQFTFTIELLTEAPGFYWNSLLLPPGKYGCNSQCCLSHRQIIIYYTYILRQFCSRLTTQLNSTELTSDIKLGMHKYS